MKEKPALILFQQSYPDVDVAMPQYFHMMVKSTGISSGVLSQVSQLSPDTGLDITELFQESMARTEVGSLDATVCAGLPLWWLVSICTKKMIASHHS